MIVATLIMAVCGQVLAINTKGGNGAENNPDHVNLAGELKDQRDVYLASMMSMAVYGLQDRSTGWNQGMNGQLRLPARRSFGVGNSGNGGISYKYAPCVATADTSLATLIKVYGAKIYACSTNDNNACMVADVPLMDSQSKIKHLILVAFAGTTLGKNLDKNLKCWLTKGPGEFMWHDGYLQIASEKCWPGIKANIKKIQQSAQAKQEEVFEYIFTGHSQGGAIATIAYANAIDKELKNLVNKNNSRLISIGAPEVAEKVVDWQNPKHADSGWMFFYKQGLMNQNNYLRIIQTKTKPTDFVPVLFETVFKLADYDYGQEMIPVKMPKNHVEIPVPGIFGNHGIHGYQKNIYASYMGKKGCYLDVLNQDERYNIVSDETFSTHGDANILYRTSNNPATDSGTVSDSMK